MKKNIKRIMALAMAIVLALAMGTVPSSAANTGRTYAHSQDIIVNYEYPDGFVMPTKYTGAYSGWINWAGTTAGAWADPAAEAQYNTLKGATRSKFVLECNATGRKFNCNVITGFTYLKDETLVATQAGQPVLLIAQDAIAEDGCRNDKDIKNLLVATTGTNNVLTSAFGANAFRGSALETLMVDAAWSSEATTTYTHKTYGSYTYTLTEQNKYVFGHEALIIDDYAFADCPNLTTVWFANEPAKLYIGEGAFTNCPNFTIHAPEGGVIEAHCRANGIAFVSTGTKAITQVEQPATGSGSTGTGTDTQPGTETKPEQKPAVQIPEMPANAWYRTAVIWGYEQGLVQGVLAEMFAPEKTCSRAQIMEILYNRAGRPDVSNVVLPFTDIPATAWYLDAIKWAYSNGVASGTSKTTFNPNGSLTRAQIVQILYNMLPTKPSTAGQVHPFVDVPAGQWYVTAITWAYNNGVVAGTSKTTFAPEDACTCAQVVQVLYNQAH